MKLSRGTPSLYRAWRLGLPGLACLLCAPLGLAAEIANGGFEDGLAGWRALYTREAGKGQAAIDATQVHGGRAAVRIEHTGERDWSFETGERLKVEPGDILELEAWVRVEGKGSVSFAVSTWDGAGKAREWSYGARTAKPAPGWQRLHGRLVVPAGVVAVQPRFLGQGAGVVRIDDVAVARRGNALAGRVADLPAELSIGNAALEVTLRTADGSLAVLDRRARRRWEQRSAAGECIVKTATRRDARRLELALYHVPTGLDVTATVALEGERPEFLVTLAANGEMPAALVYPHAFEGRKGDYLVVPMNEGISYPVDDDSIKPMRLIAYGGHGICMPFWGLTDGDAAQGAILETPDDVAIRIDRLGGHLAIAPAWEAQRGAVGYARRVRYSFFEHGGHVAIAKRYRAYAQQTGLFKTLAEKQRANPNVDRLIGAVNVWCWDRDAVGIAKELQAAGIERILWSKGQGPEGIAAMNTMGILTSRYDIYQDVMDPAKFPLLRSVHADWPTAAWPRDLMIDRDGQPTKGWGVTAKDGSMIHCGVTCDRQAVAYARERIPAELATHPYLGRFIDTTTASPWRECYHPDHPMTRTESKRWKMELLQYVSEGSRLVTGCETGHDASVPHLHFFEGMMSLGPYRVPDAGRRMAEIWTEVPERVAKFQLGHDYRLPLWELVYHDCVVSYWYWGDYNNKLPALWDKRDLFNALYGVPPMFMFTRQYWEANKARFVQSYRNTCPLVREVGLAEMTDHRFLTPDRAVQQTVFANGIAVTVNFGSAPHRLASGETVEPMGYRVSRGR